MNYPCGNLLGGLQVTGALSIADYRGVGQVDEVALDVLEQLRGVNAGESPAEEGLADEGLGIDGGESGGRPCPS